MKKLTAIALILALLCTAAAPVFAEGVEFDSIILASMDYSAADLTASSVMCGLAAASMLTEYCLLQRDTDLMSQVSASNNTRIGVLDGTKVDTYIPLDSGKYLHLIYNPADKKYTAEKEVDFGGAASYSSVTPADLAANLQAIVTALQGAAGN